MRRSLKGESFIMDKTIMSLPKRKTYLDAIKILAMFFVVYSHSDIYTLYYVHESVYKTWIYMIASMIAKTAVPLFFMVSGALLLGRKESYIVFLKRVLKFIVIIILFEFASWIVRYRTFLLGG